MSVTVIYFSSFANKDYCSQQTVRIQREFTLAMEMYLVKMLEYNRVPLYYYIW